MAEEFQESEVVFDEQVENEEENEKHLKNSREVKKSKAKKKKMTSSSSSSLPVNIPEVNHWFKYVDSAFYDEEYGDDGEMVPPHLIIARRIAGKMTSFSVCTGNGRTLKGRDLSQVRNTILRMTGFLET